MQILLDADTLLEFLLNRSEFIGKVEYLSEILGANSPIQLYLSKPGLDKIVSLVKPLSGLKKSQQLVIWLKKRIKILRLTKAVAKKAILSSAIDYESAVEIHLAIKANIDAIVTHKPSDFSSEELTIITLSDLPQRKRLEDTLSKNIKDLPAVLVIDSEQISNLDKAFYHLPSYTGVKSLEPKESSHQLDLTCSSDKVFSPSGDELLPRSRYARSTAYADVAKLRSLGLESLTCKSFLDVLKESIDRGLSIKSSARSTAYADVAKLRSLGLESLTCKTSIDTLKVGIDRGLSIKFPDLQPIKQLESTRIGGLTATALQPYENSLGSKLTKDMLPSGKGLSLTVDNLSIKPPVPQPIKQLESTRIGGLTATALQPYENSLGSKLTKDMLPSGKGLSLTVDNLSIKPPVPQSIRQLESPRFGRITATALQAPEYLLGGKLMKDILPSGKGLSLAVDSLSVKSLSQSFAQPEVIKFSASTAKYLAYEIPLAGEGIKNSLPSGKELSLAIDNLSSKSLSRSFAQPEITNFNTSTAKYLAHKSPINTLKESIDCPSQLNPPSKVDRAGLFSQTKLLESMQKANTLDSYLSRKN
jgi:hypothetical protein